MVPYNAPWEREARGFLEALFPKLAAGEHVGDRARIVRLPASFNFKYGRHHRVERVHCDPDKCYTLEQLRNMAEALPEKQVESEVAEVGSGTPETTCSFTAYVAEDQQ